MPTDCYCDERSQNPALAESMQALPPGFCGVCDVCGRPGHTRAHPSLPTSGAWCDEHWNDLLARPGLTPDRLVLFAVVAILAATLGIAVYRTLF